MEYRALSTSENNQLDVNCAVFIIIGRHYYEYLIDLHRPTLWAIFTHMLTPFTFHFAFGDWHEAGRWAMIHFSEWTTTQMELSTMSHQAQVGAWVCTGLDWAGRSQLHKCVTTAISKLYVGIDYNSSTVSEVPYLLWMQWFDLMKYLLFICCTTSLLFGDS